MTALVCVECGAEAPADAAWLGLRTSWGTVYLLCKHRLLNGFHAPILSLGPLQPTTCGGVS